MSLLKQTAIPPISYHTPCCSDLSVFRTVYPPYRCGTRQTLHFTVLKLYAISVSNRNNMTLLVKKMRANDQKNDILQNFCSINSLF